MSAVEKVIALYERIAFLEGESVYSAERISDLEDENEDLEHSIRVLTDMVEHLSHPDTPVDTANGKDAEVAIDTPESYVLTPVSCSDCKYFAENNGCLPKVGTCKDFDKFEPRDNN